MCGFAGFFDSSSRASAAEMEAAAARMAARLQHRGPDDAGAWADADAGVAFGFRRLSILDLSPQGPQPMRSPSGRYVIAFNGEIYNHRALRAELERAAQPPKFRGHSDTEVLLAAIDGWGLDRALHRCAGMFAFALWDCEKRQLHLVRDRLGERPLYYGRMGAALLFGSELKALQAYPAWRGEIDRDVLTLLLRFNYIPGPFSIFKNIRKLPPGSLITIERSAELPVPVEYWSAHRTVTTGVANRFACSERPRACALSWCRPPTCSRRKKSWPTTLRRTAWPPRPQIFAAVFAAPPGENVRRWTSTTGTGASGDTRWR